MPFIDRFPSPGTLDAVHEAARVVLAPLLVSFVWGALVHFYAPFKKPLLGPKKRRIFGRLFGEKRRNRRSFRRFLPPFLEFRHFRRKKWYPSSRLSRCKCGI